MTKFLLAALSLLFLTALSAQRWEWRTALYGGSFSYRGASAQRSTIIVYDQAAQQGYTNNPYGALDGLGYGAGVSMQRVTGDGILAGLELGYETLRSETGIQSVSVYTGTATNSTTAEGQMDLSTSFLNLYPFFGYRVPLNHFFVDVSGGFDIGVGLKAHEKGKATTWNGLTYETSRAMDTRTDIRPRVQVAAGYKRVGLFGSYAHGLTNYKAGYAGGSNECYTRVFRFGVTYRIK